MTNVSAVQDEFLKLSELLDYAMNDPAMAATPHVAAVLHLLGMGLMRLAKIVITTMEGS